MNGALYLFNALALVALNCFQFQASQNDKALIHVHADRSIARPAAQLAVMGAKTGQASLLVSPGKVHSTVAARTERYVF